MKKEVLKSPKNKGIQKEENRWTDVHNDTVMQEMGFNRPSLQSPRDPSVWSKTPNEKRILRNTKYYFRMDDGHFHTIPAKRGIVTTKLIVQLKPNKLFPKSTYSFMCSDVDVDNILSKFMVVNKKNPEQMVSIVAKYSYNGKSYEPRVA